MVENPQTPVHWCVAHSGINLMSENKVRIVVGADHGGVEIKDAVVAALLAHGYEVRDYGTQGKGSVNYADFANLVGISVADGTYDFGILCCSSGVGMSIAANRHHGVRAANVSSVEDAVTTREHNNANVLCLGAKSVDAATAVAMAEAFLKAAFSEGRHTCRVAASSGSRIEVTDPAVYAAISAEAKRQRNNIELIASENFASPAVMEAQGSLLTNKSTSSSNWPSTASRIFSVPSTPTCKLTLVPKPTPPSTSPCSNPVTAFSPWTSLTAVT